ncbi:hypothetical protein D3C78_1508690 [compost metagenome]
MQRLAPACLAGDRQAFRAQRCGQLFQPLAAVGEQGLARLVHLDAVEQHAGIQGGVEFAQQQLQGRAAVAGDPGRALERRLRRLGGVDDHQQLLELHVGFLGRSVAFPLARRRGERLEFVQPSACATTHANR